MKEGIRNEKYIILFTDLFNDKFIKDEKVKNIFDKLKINKDAILLLVGKNKIFKHINENCLNENEEENEFIIELIMNNKSEKKNCKNIFICEKIKEKNNKIDKLKKDLALSEMILNDLKYKNKKLGIDGYVARSIIPVEFDLKTEKRSKNLNKNKNKSCDNFHRNKINKIIEQNSEKNI